MKTGTIKLKDINGGWSFGFSKSATKSAPSTKPGTYYSGLLSNTRTGYEGLIGSAYNEIPITGGATNPLMINATVASDGKAYAIGNNGDILEIILPATRGVSYSAPAGCLTDNYKDIWSHVESVSGTGKDSTFFTYQTASNAYVGYREVVSGTRNDTFITLTNRNVPHVGCVSANNKSYITDGNLIRAYDPAVGAATTNVNVGQGWVTVSVVDAGNFCAIVGNKTTGADNGGSNAKLWLWDGTGTSFNYQYDIRDAKVTAVTNEGGVIKVFCSGKNGTTKIKTFSGTNFSEEADFELDSTYSESPSHGMVDIWMNQLTWRNLAGYLWTYGSLKKDLYRSGAHRVAQITTDATYGMVKNLYGSNLYIAKTVGGVNSLVYISPTTSGFATSTLKTDLYQLPHKSTIEYIEVIFAYYRVSGNVTSGSSFSLSLYKGEETVDQIAASVPNDDTLQGTNLYYFPIRKKVSDIDTFYLTATFNGCIIKEINVHYAYEDNAL